MITLLLASNNAHKLQEVKDILKEYPVDIKTPKELGLNIPEADENGKTYKDNALIKALNVARYTNLPIIADDSGLEIKEMDNMPGIYSARYAEKYGGHQKAFLEIWKNIKDKEDKSARFVCSIALVNYDEEPLIFEGEVKGKIALIDKGESGFGYDPIFIPDGYEYSFAELPYEIKNHISHRAVALNKLMKYIYSASDPSAGWHQGHWISF